MILNPVIITNNGRERDVSLIHHCSLPAKISFNKESEAPRNSSIKIEVTELVKKKYEEYKYNLYMSQYDKVHTKVI